MANPQIPMLLELKKELENEIESLTERIEKLESFIRALNSTITVGSFSTADTALGKESPGSVPPTEPIIEPEPTEEFRSVILMNKERDLELASFEVTEQEVRVIPSAHALYDIKRGAFARFFVERILGKYQEEDRHRVENDQLTWEDAFDFDVKAEDGILEEIIIRNYGDNSRLDEIERALRWALEKIYRAR
ncbi:MAG: hypothetical protein ACTSUO_10075 [Candidatus Thorarchaeota archaeon]